MGERGLKFLGEMGRERDHRGSWWLTYLSRAGQTRKPNCLKFLPKLKSTQNTTQFPIKVQYYCFLKKKKRKRK